MSFLNKVFNLEINPLLKITNLTIHLKTEKLRLISNDKGKY